MKKQSLLALSALLLCISGAQPSSISDRTFLATRPILNNLPMEMGTWTDFNEKVAEGSRQIYFQATPFFQQSINSKALGKYFGAYNDSTGSIDSYFGVGPVASDSSYQVLPKEIIHSANSGATPTIVDKIQLKPSVQRWGMRFDYYQMLPLFNDSLFVRASSAVSSVTHQLRPTSTDPSAGTTPLPSSSSTLTGFTVSALQYLQGNVSNQALTNRQESLNAARWTNSQNAIALDDLVVGFGGRLWNSRNGNNHFDISAQVVIPTSSAPKGTYLFEPTAGNRGHFGVGARLDTSYTMCRINPQTNLLMNITLDYRYLFGANEIRTLMFNETINGQISAWQPYKLAGIAGQAKVVPAANIMTRPVQVSPGNSLEGVVQLSLQGAQWSFDCGYNFFARPDESVNLANWEENTYALVNPNYDTTQIFDPTNSNHSVTGVAIAKTDLVYDRAANPSVFTHSLFVAAGYQWFSWKLPMMVGVGASLEDSGQHNSALENVSLWAKMGVHF